MKQKYEKHTREWCDEKKKTCKFCLKTNYYCKLHEPWQVTKSCRNWGGMSHQEKCPFYIQLEKNEAHAVVRYCAIVQLDSCQPGFQGHQMICPDCKGWDISVRKGL